MPQSAARAAAHASAAKDRSSLYEEITNKIIAELEAGRLPWVQPWGSSGVRAPLGMPKNAATGRTYSGINVPILWDAVVAQGYSAQSWLTFKQSVALGGHVRKGERGTTVVYADRFVPDDVRDRTRERGEAPRGIPFLKPTPMAVAVARALGYDMATIAPASTAKVAAFTQHVMLLRTYATGWRLAACAATMLCVALSALLSTAVDRTAAALYVADNGQVAKVSTGGSPFNITETAVLPVVQAANFSAPSLPAFVHPRIDDGRAERFTAFALDIGASIAAWAAAAPAPVPTATVSGFLLILTMLTAILVVADRRTDARSRRAWARLDLASGPLPPHRALVIDRLLDVPAAVTPRARLPARADIAIETGLIPLAQPGRSRRAGRRARRRRPPRTASVRSDASGRAASVPRRRGSAPLAGIGWQPPAPFAQADASLVVRDDLGYPVPIAAGELDAIETYLDPVLRDLLVYARTQRKDDG